MKKLTQDEFINKAKEIHNDKYDYSKVIYINMNVNVKIKCNTCKNIFEQTPNNHIYSKECILCKNSTQKFINKAITIHKNKYDYSLTNYINSKSKIKIKCNTCNVIFEQSPSKHLNNQGCIKCSIKIKTSNTREFIEKAKTLHKDKYDYNLVEYINSRTKVKIKCNTCNIIFEQAPDGHLHTSGCNECLIKSQTWTILEFINKAKKIHEAKYDYSLVEYKNANTKVKIICKKCKKIFEQIPKSHIQGIGCPNCNFSKGELKCEEILENNTRDYVKEVIPQFRFDNCRNIYPLPFDFKVILNNGKYFLIEYQGKQHYESTTFFSHNNLEDIQKRDKIKYDYCKINNIDLLVIKYTDFNNIEIIIKNFIENL